MIPDKYFELMNKEIDGTSTKAESARLKKHIEQNAEARQMYKSLQSLTRRLHQVQLVEPPGYLQKSIANMISGTPSPIIHRSFWNDLIAQFTSSTSTHKEAYMEQTPQGFFSGKRGILVLSGAVVAVIAIVYLAGLYPPASTENAVGTIGGVQKAKKYRSEQISERDVVLKNEKNSRMIQSDKFQKLNKSQAFQKVAKDASFQDLLKDASFQDLLKDAAFQDLLKDASFQDLMKDAAFQDLLKDAQFQDLAKDAAHQDLMKDAAFQDLMKDAGYQDLLKDAAFQDLLKDAAFQDLLKDAAFQDLLKDAAFQDLLKDAAFQDLLKDAAFQDLLKDASFQDLMKDAAKEEQ